MTLPGPRILMTADAVGGVWTYALELARGVGEAGGSTTLAVLGPDPSGGQRAQAEAIEGLELVETRLPLDWLASDPEEVLEAAAAVRALASGLDVELIHLNTPTLAACGGFDAPVIGVTHSCLATWWSAVRGGPMPEDFLWRCQLLGRGLAICDAVVAPSQAFAMATARAHAIRRPHVVRNGRDPSVEVGGEREFCVVTAGRLWDDGKNVALLDEVAAHLPVPVYAIGPKNGPMGEHAQLHHAISLGSMPSAQVAEHFARAAIFASPALYEPFGLSVLEAAQAGCALVLSDIGTFRELWDGAALFLPPRDPAAWTKALTDLLADPIAVQGLAARARARAARYTAERMTRAMLRTYAEVAPGLAEVLRQEAAA